MAEYPQKFERYRIMGGTQQNAKFLDGTISEEEFVEFDIRLWRSVKPDIHRDDIMRCYSGVESRGRKRSRRGIQRRGVYVAIVSSGVDVFVGAIASMLKVDDWAANGLNGMMVSG